MTVETSPARHPRSLGAHVLRCIIGTLFTGFAIYGALSGWPPIGPACFGAAAYLALYPDDPT